jgi:hypothetical protein
VFLHIVGYIQIIAVLFWPNGPLRTPAKVGRDTIFACFDTETLGDHSKGLYLDGTRVKRSGEETYDEGKWRALWDGSVKATGIEEGDTVWENWW